MSWISEVMQGQDTGKMCIGRDFIGHQVVARVNLSEVLQRLKKGGWGYESPHGEKQAHAGP